MRSVGLVVAGVFLGILICAVALWGAMHYAATRSATLPDKLSLNVEERFAKARARFENTANDYERWVALNDLSFWSVDVGAFDQAKAHANSLLAQAENYKADWNYGNAIHKGNLTLGRLALRGGDHTAANAYLLGAGKTRTDFTQMRVPCSVPKS